MNFFSKITIRILSNALAIYVAAKFVDGINFDITLSNLLLAAFLLALVNTFIRPVLKIISFPLIILTLGLFTVIINMAMLFLVSYLLPAFSIENISAAFWGMIVISLVNYLISHFVDD